MTMSMQRKPRLYEYRPTLSDGGRTCQTGLISTPKLSAVPFPEARLVVRMAAIGVNGVRDGTANSSVHRVSDTRRLRSHAGRASQGGVENRGARQAATRRRRSP